MKLIPLMSTLVVVAVVFGASPRTPTLKQRVESVADKDETGVFHRPISRTALVVQVEKLSRRIRNNVPDITHGIEQAVYSEAYGQCLAENIALLCRLHVLCVQLDDANNERWHR